MMGWCCRKIGRVKFFLGCLKMSSENKEEKRLDFIVAKEGNKPLILSPEKLKELVSKGEIKGDDLIFRENLKVWTKARYVKGLRSLIAKLESSSSVEGADSEDDLIDDLLNEIDAEEEKTVSKESIENQKTSELPPVLASLVTGKNLKKNTEITFDCDEIVINKVMVDSPAGESKTGKYSEIKSGNSAKVKSYVLFGIIIFFGTYLVYANLFNAKKSSYNGEAPLKSTLQLSFVI